MVVLQDLPPPEKAAETGALLKVTDVAVIEMSPSGSIGAIKLHGPAKRQGLGLWPRAAVARTSRFAEEDRVRSRVLALERSRASTWNWDLSTDVFSCSGESAGLYGHGSQPPPRDGATWLLRIHRDDRERVAAEFRRCREGRSDSLCIEYRVNLDETRTRWVLTRGALANLFRAESRSMVGMTVDVTALHRARIISKVTDLALGRQTADAIEQISGAVAHDLNDLLSIISNLAELQRGGPGSPQIAELSRQIIATAARGALLTRKLSLLGKLGGARSMTLAEGLGGITDLMRLSAHENVHVRFSIGVDAWSVHVDPSALKLAVVNLAINSGHAMPDGGTLTVTSVNSILSGNRSQELHLESGEFLEIGVSDTGPAMSADALSHVFESDPGAGSAGRDPDHGLAQVRAFALSSGGAVQARSTRGVGTTITLYLPRALPAEGMRSLSQGAMG